MGDYCGDFQTGTSQVQDSEITEAVSSVTTTTVNWAYEITWTITDAAGATTCEGGPYCPSGWIGNGWCNEECNTAAYDFDGGDCGCDSSTCYNCADSDSCAAADCLWVEGGGYFGEDVCEDIDIYEEACTLEAGSTYTLSCIDSWGDGWHLGTISIDGNDYCGDFQTGTSQVQDIEITEAVSSVTTTTVNWAYEITWTITDAAGATTCEGGPYCPSGFIGDGWCDAACNTAAYDFDGGDCECTSTSCSNCDNDACVATEYCGWLPFLGEDGGYCSQTVSYDESCILGAGQHVLRCEDEFGDGWHQGFITIAGQDYCGDFTSGLLQEELVTLDNSINSVSVTVTDWPYEITWSIGDDLCTGGPYPHDFAPPDNSGGDAVAIPEATVTVTFETPLSVAEQENVRDAYCDTMQTVTGSGAIVCSITEVANRRRLLSVSYVL